MSANLAKSFLGPLQEKKNPYLAALYGSLLGPCGLAIYFSSWKEFWVTGVPFLIVYILTPLWGQVIGWLLVGTYGYFRAIHSNRQIDVMITGRK
jgi:hypothetical protein